MDLNIHCNHNWAKSSNQNPISLIEFNSNTERPVLFIGGVHGDEPEGVWLAEALLNWCYSVKLQNGLATLHNFLLIPCLNPDGYRQLERVNGKGVDLNRNFPSRDWSPEQKAPRYNPGPEPASEPEVRALIDLINQRNPSLIIHFHSWKPAVVYTGAPAKSVAQILAKVSGYDLQEDIGYPTPGSLGQYAWLEKQIPVICIEEQEGCERSRIWPRWKPGLLEILRGAINGL